MAAHLLAPDLFPGAFGPVGDALAGGEELLPPGPPLRHALRWRQGFQFHLPGLALPLGFAVGEPRLPGFEWFKLGAFAGRLLGGGLRGAGGGFEPRRGESGPRPAG